jgi:hypothetical protein
MTRMTRQQIGVYVVISLFWAALSGGVVYLFTTGQASAASFETASPTATPGPEFPGAQRSFVGHGRYHVPEEAPPGTYQVTSASTVYGCSYKILSKDSSAPKWVIDSGSFNKGGFASFAIPRSARIVELGGDCTWTRDGGPQ